MVRDVIFVHSIEKEKVKIRILIQGLVLLFVFILLGSERTQDLQAGGEFQPVEPETPAFLLSDPHWVDSVLAGMNLDQKIAQMLMIAGYSNKGEDHLNELIHMVEKYGVGGIIFFQGGPVRQAIMTNKLQSVSRVPLLIAMDAEWGLAMRLDSTLSYPKQMMLGGATDNTIIYQMGIDIGRQLKRLGVHISFSPVADVNNNPGNPVINMRSFGENPASVAIKSLLYAQGLLDANIMPVYKHFPGHGDTQTDSHHDLPVINHSMERLDSVELMPFRFGIHRGIPAIMSAHLNIPALDTTPNLASSLSKPVIGEFLRDSLGFQGLVFTDAMNMKGVSAWFKPGDAEVKAFLAGNDIILMPADVPKAIAAIKKEIKQGNISEDLLDERVKRILHAKAWTGAGKARKIEIRKLYDDLNQVGYEVERRKMIRESLILVRNEGRIIPFQNPENYRIAALTIGSGQNDSFTETLRLYVPADTFLVSHADIKSESDSLFIKLRKHNSLIISIQQTSQYASRAFGIKPELQDFLNRLSFEGNTSLVVFGNPYILGKLQNLDKFQAIVLAADDTETTRFLAAQSIFGAYPFKGILPVTADSTFPAGTGVMADEIGRLSYGLPEEEGMRTEVLKRIDTIAAEAISIKATPGCQILVSRSGRVIWNKSYGYTSYNGRTKVTNNHIYDLASITKITATLPLLMKLYAENRISLEGKLGDYLSMPDTCNKKDLKINEILAHQAGLQAWIPFYYSTLEPVDTSEKLLDNKMSDTYPYKVGTKVYANRNIRWKEMVYSDQPSDQYPWRVADHLYLKNEYHDSVYNRILSSELLSRTYRYSDLGYYLFQKMIEEMSGQKLETLSEGLFFSKMGAYTLGYQPLNKYPRQIIVPTENDMVFRKQILQGDVHDPGAAMLGGVAGHAGLFSNANDLAKFMQMYLNRGYYGGREYLPDSVINRFTARAFNGNGNRRALGFDKPEPNGKGGPACSSAPSLSYGHTGFTGTMVWVDPVNELVFVFLSNRIHPNQHNNLLTEKDIRTRIQQVVYDAL